MSVIFFLINQEYCLLFENVSIFYFVKKVQFCIFYFIKYFFIFKQNQDGYRVSFKSDYCLKYDSKVGLCCQKYWGL